MSGSSKPRSSRRASHPKESSSSQPEATWPTISFLFTINSLNLNEEPANGGVAPRVDAHGRWLPPLYQAGFASQALGTLYRWQNGVVTQATGYQWYEGAWWGQAGVANSYREITMFYSNPWDQFLATHGDASTRDIANAPVPDNRWYTLSFHNYYSLSRVDIAGPEPYLAGNGSRFIDQLGIRSWCNPDQDAPPADGLAGNLALLIALIAFSCRSDRLDTVLRHSWSNYGWRSHTHNHGRREGKGVVVKVYYDPQNPTQSTQQTLTDLEWNGGRLL